MCLCLQRQAKLKLTISLQMRSQLQANIGFIAAFKRLVAYPDGTTLSHVVLTTSRSVELLNCCFTLLQAGGTINASALHQRLLSTAIGFVNLESMTQQCCSHGHVTCMLQEHCTTSCIHTHKSQQGRIPAQPQGSSPNTRSAHRLPAAVCSPDAHLSPVEVELHCVQHPGHGAEQQHPVTTGVQLHKHAIQPEHLATSSYHIIAPEVLRIRVAQPGMVAHLQSMAANGSDPSASPSPEHNWIPAAVLQTGQPLQEHVIKACGN